MCIGDVWVVVMVVEVCGVDKPAALVPFKTMISRRRQCYVEVPAWALAPSQAPQTQKTFRRRTGYQSPPGLLCVLHDHAEILWGVFLII